MRAAFRLLRRVSSPYLPVVHELLTDPDGDLWLVTGLVAGEPLGPGPVPVARALAEAAHPVLMAGAMRQAVEAGRAAYLAGRMPRKFYAASASSPTSGLIS